MDRNTKLRILLEAGWKRSWVYLPWVSTELQEALVRGDEWQGQYILLKDIGELVLKQRSVGKVTSLEVAV
jgi:hypothetical protein